MHGSDDDRPDDDAAPDRGPAPQPVRPDPEARSATPADPGATAAEGPGPRVWTRHGRRPGPDLRLFRVRHDDLENPRTGAVLERLVLETPDWVNVVALTPERRAVCVRQYRFGVERVTLEIPGGMVDPGEEHGDAARRELAEETGYEAERWRYLGYCEPNPAVQDNRLHTWLAEGCRRVAEPTPDEGEDIQVLELELDDLVERARRGEVRHALVLCGLLRIADLRTDRDADGPEPG